MCCLSKALGAPVGSMLGGDEELIEDARRERRILGGAMRQSGVLAAAGIVALGLVERLAEDHARARRLAAAVADRWPDIGFDPGQVTTNVVVFAPPRPAAVLAQLAGAGVLAGTIAPGVIRLVTHRDVDDDGIALAVSALRAAR
jgi:threonine aldolase